MSPTLDTDDTDSDLDLNTYKFIVRRTTRCALRDETKTTIVDVSDDERDALVVHQIGTLLGNRYMPNEATRLLSIIETHWPEIDLSAATATVVALANDTQRTSPGWQCDIKAYPIICPYALHRVLCTFSVARLSAIDTDMAEFLRDVRNTRCTIDQRMTTYSTIRLPVL